MSDAERDAAEFLEKQRAQLKQEAQEKARELHEEVSKLEAQQAFDALQLEGTEGIRRALATLEQYEPLVEHVMGLRKRLIADGFPSEMAASMAAMTYVAGIAPLVPGIFGGTS